MNHHYLSRKRARGKSGNEKNKCKRSDSQIKSNLKKPLLVRNGMRNKKENKPKGILQIKPYYYPKPSCIKSSQYFFSILTHLEMKTSVFSYLTQREINSLISSIQNKDFQSMLLKSSTQIINERLSLKSKDNVFLNESLQMNNSNNYLGILFNHLPSTIALKDSKFFLQIDDTKFYLVTNNLYYYKANVLRNKYVFSKEFITHVQVMHLNDHLLAIFCFNSIKIMNYETGTIQDELHYSGNYLLLNRELKMYIITSDLSGTLFFHSTHDANCKSELNLFRNGIDIIPLHNSNISSRDSKKIAAYSVDAKDSNDIHLINLETLQRNVINEFNKNNLLSVSQMMNDRQNWLISVDCEEVIVWDFGLNSCEMRINLHLNSIIRVNYCPEVRRDCFVVCTKNAARKTIEGWLVLVEAKNEESRFNFFYKEMSGEEDNESVYSVSKYDTKGIQLEVFLFNQYNLVDCNQIEKYSYVISDR